MRSLLFAVVLVLSGCATTGSSNPRDPWEPLNRATFAFNERADRVVLKPLARGYEAVVPAFVRERVNSFFENLADLGTGLHNVLQGKPEEALNDFGRFLLNSTFGLAGLFDIASAGGFEKHNEDFGQTLGAWGVGPGPYLVLPLLGPSTARDAPAKAGDPSWYYNNYLDDRLYWSLFALDAVRIRANLLKAESVVQEAALDRYTFVRDAWLQRRRSQVYDGNPPREKEED